MTLAIGVDVGGTKVAAGVVDEDGRILAKLKRSTPAASPARTEQTIADVVTDLQADYEVGAIGLGAAGFVDSAGATIVLAPHPGGGSGAAQGEGRGAPRPPRRRGERRERLGLGRGAVRGGPRLPR